MADSSVNITASGSTAIDTRTTPAGDHRQVIVIGEADTANVVPLLNGGLRVAQYQPTTVNRSSVAAATTDTRLLAAASRHVATVYNNSSSALYLGLGSAAVSTSSFSVVVDANGYFEAPLYFSGEIRGLWAAAVGSAAVTEVS